MPDLDDGNPRLFGQPCVAGDLIAAQAVRYRVVAIAKRRVADKNGFHRNTRDAISSATAIAAQLMMSRFPA